MPATTTGLTADGTWQFGVRRTLPLPTGEAWALLERTTGDWLGDPDATLSPGATFAAPDGAHGEVTSATPGVVARLRWYAGPDAPATTLQVRTMEAATGTTVAFHHERLPSQEDREALGARWTAAVKALR